MSGIQSYERKRGVDSNDIAIIGATQNVNASLAAETGMALEDVKGIVVDTESVLRTDQLDEEVFMREWMEIHLHDPANEDEPVYAEVTVNGDKFVSIRGETKKVRRYHVAALAQAKALRLVQTKVTNEDGSMGYREKAVLRLVYPFSVIHDANPKGGAWLRQQLGNPA